MIELTSLDPDTGTGREMADLVLGAVHKIPPGTTCGHVIGVGAMCVRHPYLGVLCMPCARQHTRTHDLADEHRCDRCGDVDTTMTGVTVHLATILRGHLITVWALGVGLCGACTHTATHDGRGGVG